MVGELQALSMLCCEPLPTVPCLFVAPSPYGSGAVRSGFGCIGSESHTSGACKHSVDMARSLLVDKVSTDPGCKVVSAVHAPYCGEWPICCIWIRAAFDKAL